MRRFSPFIPALALLATLAWPASATAQQSIEEVLGFLLTNQAVATGDFVKDAAAAEVTRDTITRSLLVELTTLPLSSSSAGFSYRFNPTLGTPERASSSFGPFFTERSLTAGARQASLGISVQSASYARLDSYRLRDGSFVTTANQFRDERTPFDVEALTLRLRSDAITFYGNLGVHDRIDVGAAIPVVRLSLDGERINTYRGTRLVQATAQADTTGLGDVALRSKVRLLGQGGSGLSVVGELRLPTGSEENLLGSGDTSFRALAIASTELGRFAAHGNVGYQVGGLSDEVNYRGALSYAASSRVTVIGELLGRRIEELGRLTEERAPHPTIAGVDTLRLIATGGGTNTVAWISGVKWNVAGTWLVNANVSVPVTDRGLRSKVVTLFSLDYAFGGS